MQHLFNENSLKNPLFICVNSYDITILTLNSFDSNVVETLENILYFHKYDCEIYAVETKVSVSLSELNPCLKGRYLNVLISNEREILFKEIREVLNYYYKYKCTLSFRNYPNFKIIFRTNELSIKNSKMQIKDAIVGELDSCLLSFSIDKNNKEQFDKIDPVYFTEVISQLPIDETIKIIYKIENKCKFSYCCNSKIFSTHIVEEGQKIERAYYYSGSIMENYQNVNYGWRSNVFTLICSLVYNLICIRNSSANELNDSSNFIDSLSLDGLIDGLSSDGLIDDPLNNPAVLIKIAKFIDHPPL